MTLSPPELIASFCSGPQEPEKRLLASAWVMLLVEPFV